MGLKFKGVMQAVEAYCDDVHVLTNEEEDLKVVDAAVRKFEKLSGAILSRGQKCTILGLGKWKNKQNWPLTYVKVKEEVKVFGIFFSDSYRNILKRNWDYRFEKFQGSVYSWQMSLQID